MPLLHIQTRNRHVANGEDDDMFAVVVIQNDVGALAEFNDRFSK